MNAKQTMALITGAALLGAAVTGIASAVSAQTATAPGQTGTSTPWGMHKGFGFGRGMMERFARGVRGTVTAVNGTSITVTGKDGQTYTVDASASHLEKVSVITAADIKVGDTLDVQGKVSGSSVAAKNIVDGLPLPPNPPKPAQ